MKLFFLSLSLLLVAVSGGMGYHQNDYTLVYERTEAIRTDGRFFNLKARTFKYNRTLAVTNFTIETKIDFGNDIKVVVQGYRFASNEYRLFPIVYDRMLCKSLEENEFGVRNIYDCGNAFRCSINRGNYSICNWSIDGSQAPPYIPSGHYKLELRYFYFSTEVGAVEVYLTAKRFFDRK